MVFVGRLWLALICLIGLPAGVLLLTGLSLKDMRRRDKEIEAERKRYRAACNYGRGE